MRWATRSALWALLLIGIGVILLLRNLDVWPQDVRIWPPALIAIGIWLLAERVARSRQPSGGLVAPFVLLGIGVMALLEDLDVFTKKVSVWPVVLIAIGLAALIDALTWRQRQRRRPTAQPTEHQGLGSAHPDRRLGLFHAVCGDGDEGTLA